MRATRGTDRLFVDSVRIIVRGGKGGDGCVSFRREKFVPKGGPDGGDGGDGGSVNLIAREGVDTLLELTGRHHWFADNGRPGAGSNCHGRNGGDLDVVVPVGTLVYDDQSGRLLKDMVHNEQSVVVGRGGKGGRGNARFATATHQVPREREPGEPGAERTLRLELKLIADVGLVGLPNAGKSTLLSRMTNARPKVAAYPFTTQTPQLGITELPGFRRIVLADIPGLMEGAHDGVGLGDTFLRHIERTRLIVHLIDLCPPEGGPTPIEAYRTIRTELERYSPRLAASAEIIVGNKMDLTDADAALEDLRKQLDRPVVPYSGATGHNQRQLAEAMWLAVQNAKLTEPSEAPAPIDFGNPTASASDGPEDFGGLDLRIDPKPPARTDPAESEGREP